MKLLVVSEQQYALPHLWLAVLLMESGVDIRVVLQTGSPSVAFLNAHHVPVIEYPFRNRADFGSMRALRQVIRQWQPDVIHAYTGKTCWLTIMAQWPRKRARLVLYRGAARRPSRWVPSDRLMFFGNWVDAYDCLSRAVGDSLISGGVDGTKVHVNHYGHLLEWYEKPSGTHVPPPEVGRSRIGVIVNYRPVKGLEVLLDAADVLHEQGVNFELVWVGRDENGKFASRIQRARCCDNIRAVGPVSPPWDWMRTFDCLVVPSLQEGLSKTALEGFGCGVPVVASRVGGLMEVVQHDVNGLLVPPGQPKELAAAIRKVITDRSLADRYREQGRLTMVNQFNLAGTRDRLLSLYKRLAAGNGLPQPKEPR